MNIEEELIKHYGCKDKQDLQEYLGDFTSIEMIKSFGIFCYNQAIDDAVENVTLKDKEIIYTGARAGGSYYIKVVDEDSILELKK